MISNRDIEKLKALGFDHRNGIKSGFDRESFYVQAKAHLQSPEVLKATMADKMRFLVRVKVEEKGDRWVATPLRDGDWNSIGASGWVPRTPIPEGEGDSPEAAVDALFWKVP